MMSVLLVAGVNVFIYLKTFSSYTRYFIVQEHPHYIRVTESPYRHEKETATQNRKGEDFENTSVEIE
jgi:hypothetical protein